MRLQTLLRGGWAIAAIVVSFLLPAEHAAAQRNDPGAKRAIDADKARVVEYWSESRRRAAQPRDLVLDARGLGYLRQRDGVLVPHGHQISAEAGANVQGQGPVAGPGSGNDTTAPSIADMVPGANAQIGASATFSATVTDTGSGVRSVTFVLVYPDGFTTQAISAIKGSGDTWSRTIEGFSDGSWSWRVEARDNGKGGGNRATSPTVNFTVNTGGGGGGGGGGGSSDTVTNAVWNLGGNVQEAAGRIYFEMPGNAKRRGPWAGYVCSGTAVADGTTGRSLVLTAAHCVYDDTNKAYARNVLFIPDQAHTTASGTDTNCNNDPLGCWVPTIGVVDVNWTTRTFPNNINWDYAFYVVEDSGAHVGPATGSSALDSAVIPLAMSFNAPSVNDGTQGAGTSDFTHALGYSYSEDPKFMYCAEDMTTEGSVNWWLPGCGLSGGSSGGPWMQPVNGGNGIVISVNSWGYTGSPGMAGPKLDLGSALCLFQSAGSTPLAGSFADGDAGAAIPCP
jgi:hypothetical protein